MRDLRARKQAEQHIRFLAHHDALTGLPNRNAFNKRLDREIDEVLSTGARLAVLCLDLDRFKDINDVFGHAVGDQMLQVFGNRVTALLESGQTMARGSGRRRVRHHTPALEQPSHCRASCREYPCRNCAGR